MAAIDRTPPDLAPRGLPSTGLAGDDGSPHVVLHGFSGPLAVLLTAARGQQVDLAGLRLADLADQLTASLQQAAALADKADWVVMTAWLLLLRSRLLLPPEAPARQAAAGEIERLRGSLLQLQQVQAAAGWLRGRPQLGLDVFARGKLADTQDRSNASVGHEVDVIEFLWASLVLFDADLKEVAAVAAYRPYRLDLYSMPEARARVALILADAVEPQPLERLLPARMSENTLLARSAWASTFTASLELARQGEAVLLQDAGSATVLVGPISADDTHS